MLEQVQWGDFLPKNFEQVFKLFTAIIAVLLAGRKTWNEMIKRVNGLGTRVRDVERVNGKIEGQLAEMTLLRQENNVLRDRLTRVETVYDLLNIKRP